MRVVADLKGALRKLKPEKRVKRLVSRDRAELLDARAIPFRAGTKVLLDTNIYVRIYAGELAPEIRRLIERAALYHCSVCLAELAAGLANADVKDRRWADQRRAWQEEFDSIRPARIKNPDPSTWIEAAVIAGTLSRLQGFGKDQHKAVLNDALIYLTATNAGIPILTENRRDFDFIQQLAPGGTVYFVLSAG